MQRLGFGSRASDLSLRRSHEALVRLLAIVAIIGSVLAPARAAASPTHLALVIGNAEYPSARLATGANDAGLVAETLAQVGFDVTAMANVDGKMLDQTVRAFETKARSASPDAIIVIYLAGYGLQYDGDTYFVPLDARITRGSDLPAVAMRLSDLSKAIEAVPAQAHVFIYDLAHEHPFVVKDDMPLAGGLAPTDAPKGSLYATNAAPGCVAPADLAPYGAYARALSEMIQEPGIDLAEMFRRVRLRMGEYTDGAVVPWDEETFDAPVALSGPPPVLTPTDTPQPIDSLSPSTDYSTIVARDQLAGYADFVRAFPSDTLTPRVKMMLAARREALFWRAASHANDAAAYWTYMRRYPRRAHYYDARLRLAALKAPLEPPPRFEITLFPDLPPPTDEEIAIMDRPAIIVADPDWAPIPAPPLALLPSTRAAFTDELPPPPTLPTTILPVPIPVTPPIPATPPTVAAPAIAGLVTQPLVPALGEVIGRTDATSRGQTSVTLAGPKGLISRSTATDKQGVRTITQSGPGDIVLSRTTILRDIRGATIVQTGPSGGVLTKSLTWTTSNGARSTLIRNGGNQIVADIKRNDHGIVVSATSGVAPPPRPATAISAPVQLPRPAAANQAPAKSVSSEKPVAAQASRQVPQVGPPQPINPAPRQVSPPPAPLAPATASPPSPLSVPSRPPVAAATAPVPPKLDAVRPDATKDAADQKRPAQPMIAPEARNAGPPKAGVPAPGTDGGAKRLTAAPPSDVPLPVPRPARPDTRAVDLAKTVSKPASKTAKPAPKAAKPASKTASKTAPKTASKTASRR